MNSSTLKDKWALVTGASSGLGVDFARNLAERGCNLILVARREDRLRDVQQELIDGFGVEAEVISMDLAPRDAPQQLYDQITGDGKQVDVLINNAGFGLYGEFIDIPWERERAMLELDIITVVHLTKLFAKDMKDRNFGFILQVASIGAYVPSPLYATYSAAKSFVLSFGEALNYELRNTNVHCTVVSPGVARSEFRQVAGQEPTLYQRLVMMDSARVTKIGIDAMLKGKPSVVPGWLNAFSALATRLIPRRLATAFAYRTME